MLAKGFPLPKLSHAAFQYNYFDPMCGSRKYPYSPHRRDWKFRGRGVSKTQKFKAMYEAKLEFPEGWRGGGGHRANPFCGGGGGGMDIFWSHTTSSKVNTLYDNACACSLNANWQ